MGLFSSKDHLYNYLEEVVVDRNFLNLHKSIKNFDFDQRSKTNSNDKHKIIYENLSYDFFINKRRVRFSSTKRTIKNYELYFDYCEAEMISKTDKGYIGLPGLSDMKEAKSLFPFRILELASVVLIKEKYKGRNRERFIDAGSKYYLWISPKENGSWEDELVKDFNITASKLIRETLKNLSKLKKNQ
ncbi:hypothetical protein OAT04_05530 [Candidatus Pelagibacter sp.]|nr:hypothetical protein [Candidatus Pelagibacter sp.]